MNITLTNPLSLCNVGPTALKSNQAVTIWLWSYTKRIIRVLYVAYIINLHAPISNLNTEQSFVSCSIKLCSETFISSKFHLLIFIFSEKGTGTLMMKFLNSFIYSYLIICTNIPWSKRTKPWLQNSEPGCVHGGYNFPPHLTQPSHFSQTAVISAQQSKAGPHYHPIATASSRNHLPLTWLVQEI